MLNGKKNIFWIILLYILSHVFYTTEASAAGDQLLSLDETIFVQFIVFIIAVYLLNSLFFKPLLKLEKRRKELTIGTLEEAGHLNDRAEKIIEEYENKISSARAEAFEQRAEVRREAQQAAENMVAEARERSQNSLEEHKNQIRSQVSKIKEQIKPEIEQLAKQITYKVLGKEV